MGKTIHSEGRNLILKVLKFFETEKANRQLSIPIEQVIKRTCAATEISKTTLMTIKREAKKLQASSSKTSLSTPGKKRKKSAKKIELDRFDICALRNIVTSFYTAKKEIPTLKKILAVAKNYLNFQGERTTLRSILINELGYKFKKCKNDRTVLIQKPDIAAWRSRYLRRKHENNELGVNKKPITYVYQTCIRSNDLRGGQNSEGSKKILDKDRNCILVHVGGENGFVPGAQLMIKSASDELDAKTFLKWLEDQLVPSLPRNTIVVIDNAPYNTTEVEKPPTSTSLAHEMQNWLRTHKIPFSDRMTSRELYSIILKTKPPKSYVVDNIMRKHGHEILRLPPCHYDIHPMEYIWNLVKQRVVEKNQSGEDIELTKDALNSVTISDWGKVMKHVERLEREYRENDDLEDKNRRQLIFCIGDESETDTTGSDNESLMSGVEEFQIVSKLSPNKLYIDQHDITSIIDNTVAPEHRVKLLQSLSILELSLVIAMMHGMEIFDGQPMNFEMVLHRYTKFANENSSTQTVPRPVILKAFEHLQSLEIIMPVRTDSTSSDTTTSRVQKEYKLYTLAVPVEDIKDAVKGFKALPTEIQHWANNSLV